jgi:drug/metabolite transporter (DMT)-like permease
VREARPLALSHTWLSMSCHVALAAGTYVLSKPAAVGFASAAALTFARAAIASAMLLLLLALRWLPVPRFSRRDTWIVLGLGTLLVLNQYVYLHGMKLTVPGHAPLLYALTPSGVLLLVALRERRLPRVAQLGGVVLALIGVVVLLRPWESGLGASELREGDLWIGIAVLLWIVYTVAVRSLIQRYDARAVTAWTLIAGTLVFAPLGAPALAAEDLGSFAAETWAGLLWLALMTSVAMMLLWNYLLQHLEPVAVAICANAQPPATALLVAVLSGLGLFAGDPDLGPIFWCGMGLVLAGVVWVQVVALRERNVAQAGSRT